MTFEKKQETLKKLSKVLRHSIFPVNVDINNLKDHVIYQGLTKREYFASQAMNSLVENYLVDTETEMETLASVAVCMAEALIHELNKTKP